MPARHRADSERRTDSLPGTDPARRLPGNQDLGADVSGLLAAGGIAGLTIGFAARDTLANLFAGIFIFSDGPYKIGDFITLDSGERGMVTEIGIRSTRLLTRGDIEITIPNAVMGNAKINNESGGPQVKYRIRVRVGVAYGSDVDHIEAVQLQVATDNDKVVLSNPEMSVNGTVMESRVGSVSG